MPTGAGHSNQVVYKLYFTLTTAHNKLRTIYINLWVSNNNLNLAFQEMPSRLFYMVNPD